MSLEQEIRVRSFFLTATKQAKIRLTCIAASSLLRAVRYAPLTAPAPAVSISGLAARAAETIVAA